VVHASVSLAALIPGNQRRRLRHFHVAALEYRSRPRLVLKDTLLAINQHLHQVGQGEAQAKLVMSAVNRLVNREVVRELLDLLMMLL